ncbi:MAG: endonuclease MutS2 [candidate division Zixibacteria bacterium]|nr:endonuclease MutS2 [candidate division Zixibacteria bacterium]
MASFSSYITTGLGRFFFERTETRRINDMIEQHTLDTLEFPKVVASMAGKCLTIYGSVKTMALTPGLDLKAIVQSQTEISQMKDIIVFGDAFPLYRIETDSRELLQRSKVSGHFLDPLEIRVILELIEISINLFGYDKEARPKIPALDEYLKRIRAYPELKKEINKTIDETGAIKDNASPKLKQLRMEHGEIKRKIISRLENILSGQRKVSGWQDDVVTQRNGRYVIPVIAGQFRGDLGILHDRSQSGATFYVEPAEAVELNNRIHLLMQEERVEIDRILRALTAEIAQRADSLLENIELIGHLDFLHAAATFAVKQKSVQPIMVDAAELSLINARHPLLITQLGSVESVMPMSLSLDDNRQAILVTGPNTGGKTIALKTVGLLTLMAQAGLLIPAGEKSSMGIFTQVFADIGDEQSIELSLSTFSSHTRTIVNAIKKADGRSLLLFDEIGAGTDPKEGAALAEAIILHVISTGAKMIVTTHYSQLKTLAMDQPEIENASLEFNRQTLAPTYVLQLGLPGSSYAVEIASRLGMPQKITERASALIGKGERSLSELIANLQSDLATIRTDKIKLTERLEKAKELEDFYRLQTEKLQREIETEKKRALFETDEILARTRKDTEKLVADIRQTQAAKQSVKEMHRTLRATAEEVKKKRETIVESDRRPSEQIAFAVGDRVQIVSLNQEGSIEELVGDDRARLSVGTISTVVKLRDLKPAEESQNRSVVRRVSRTQVENRGTSEIHLRGMTVEEALEALEKFLDYAMISGLSQIYVIHGKGTGTLRRTLSEYLKKHAEVDSIRMGDWNEGGAGVTVVKLKA